jgi:hypothetical protein
MTAAATAEAVLSEPEEAALFNVLAFAALFPGEWVPTWKALESADLQRIRDWYRLKNRSDVAAIFAGEGLEVDRDGRHVRLVDGLPPRAQSRKGD